MTKPNSSSSYRISLDDLKPHNPTDRVDDEKKNAEIKFTKITNDLNNVLVPMMNEFIDKTNILDQKYQSNKARMQAIRDKIDKINQQLGRVPIEWPPIP